MINVLVLGFYSKNNIGDDLFIEAFKNLFPNFNLTFTSDFNSELLKTHDVVFFGGGSFVYADPLISADNLKLLFSKKIFYLGIGIEKFIHPTHIELMKKAQLIATRSLDQLDRIKEINSNSIFVPDLVYSLQHLIKTVKVEPKSILVLPNIAVVPKWFDDAYKHSSWNYFKSEFAQTLDYFIEEGYKVKFFSMSTSASDSDISAATEINNAMRHRGKFVLSSSISSVQMVSLMLSKFELIITQRFHGIVLAEMLNKPYISIHHHDKLKFAQPHNGRYLSYYGIYKQNLIDSVNENIKLGAHVSSKKDFKELQDKVESSIKGG